MLKSPLPAVHRGTLFEKQALHVLQTYFSMSLERVGGKDDGGVDLRGWWWLPPLKALSCSTKSTTATDANAGSSELSLASLSRIRVIGQCKAEKKKMGPNYVREMEGVLHRHLHAPKSSSKPISRISMEDGEKAFKSKQHPTVALVVSASPFTKAAVMRAFSSTLPFLLLYLPFDETRTTYMNADINTDSNDELSSQQLGSVVWNAALGSGVLGDELELRWERVGNEFIQTDSDVSRHSGRPGLWWNKKPIQNWVPSHV